MGLFRSPMAGCIIVYGGQACQIENLYTASRLKRDKNAAFSEDFEGKLIGSHVKGKHVTRDSLLSFWRPTEIMEFNCCCFLDVEIFFIRECKNRLDHLAYCLNSYEIKQIDEIKGKIYVSLKSQVTPTAVQKFRVTTFANTAIMRSR